MRTIAGKPLWVTVGVILLLLCDATVVPAAQTPKPQEGSNGDLSAYAGAAPSPTSPADQATQPGAAVGSPLDPSYSLVGVLSRTRGAVSTSHPDAKDTHPLAQDLWSSRIATPTADDAEARLSLRRLIDQVRSVRFEDRTSPPTMTPPAAPQPTTESPGRPEDHQQATPRMAAAAAEATAPLSAQAQKTLKTLQQNPSQAKDPLAMAELLFLSGRTPEAVPFYQRALEQTRPDDPAVQADRAWILFQLGNCLRDTDAAKAQQVYQTLIAEYPGSPWTELAKAHGRLLTWHQQDRPRELAAWRQP